MSPQYPSLSSAQKRVMGKLSLQIDRGQQHIAITVTTHCLLRVFHDVDHFFIVFDSNCLSLFYN